MKVVRSLTFWQDLQGITDYFSESNAVRTGLRFARALDDTIDFIARFPNLGNPWESPDPDLATLRYRLVRKFNRFLVVYRRHKTSVVILRVFHSSRNIEELLSE